MLLHVQIANIRQIAQATTAQKHEGHGSPVVVADYCGISFLGQQRCEEFGKGCKKNLGGIGNENITFRIIRNRDIPQDAPRASPGRRIPLDLYHRLTIQMRRGHGCGGLVRKNTKSAAHRREVVGQSRDLFAPYLQERSVLIER